MEVTSLIEKAKQVYSAAGLDCGAGLLPPADDSVIDALSRELSLPIPLELREVLRAHGGQEYLAPGVSGLFGEHRLLTPAEIIDTYQMYLECCLRDPLPTFPPAEGEWGYWIPQLIPFASWDAYDLCIHAESGDVWEFIPNTGLVRYRPSIAAVLREVIDAVRAGREAQLDAMRGPR